MSYIALYRKWRPQDFSSLVGQEHIKAALTNALSGGRVAHAYLFAGPRGTGKTSTAKILAKAVNCQHGPTPNPCNECDNCKRINDGSSMDVFEIDAASNRGIEEMRSLREAVRFSPVEGKKRVYIIDEVHMLTTEAFNALLKTLEEPPEHVLFILATTEPHKIPATIHSRCQRYDFRRMGVEDTVARLKEVAEGSGLEAEEEALVLIAAQADGGMRDALSLLDQCSVMADGVIKAETVRSLLGVVGREHLRLLVSAVGRREEGRSLEILEEILATGKDVRQAVGEMLNYLRAVMLFKVAPAFPDIYVTDDRENLSAAANLFSHDRLTASGKRLHEAALEFRSSAQPRITAEMCLLDICHISDDNREVDMLKRIERLEGLLAGRTAEPEKAKNMPAVAIQTASTAVPKEAAPSIRAEQAAAINAAPIPEEIKPAALCEKSAPDVPNADESSLWESILGKLLAERKKSLHACLNQGKLVSVADGKLRIEFSALFSCERMKKDDYRLVVEKIASELSGQPTFLECLIAGGAENPVLMETPKSSSKEAEIPAAVKKALEVFGGELIKIKK